MSNKTLPSLSYQIAGPSNVPWLTFIPGIGNDASFWRVQAEALSDSFRVLTFDPWGHATSPVPPQGFGFEDVLNGVLQLWDTLGIARSSVVGLGFGGSVALALALKDANRIERVIACCCRPRQPDDRRDFWRARIQSARTDGLDALADVTVDRWFSPEFRAQRPEVDAELRAMMKRTTVEGYCAYVNAFIEMDFEAQLPSLRVPTLLLAAEHDHGGGPVEDMRAMATRIPGSTLDVIAGSGHICNHEKPEVVTALLRKFLA